MMPRGNYQGKAKARAGLMDSDLNPISVTEHSFF